MSKVKQTTRGTLLPLNRFWHLARDPKDVFEYACSLLQETASAAGVEFNGARVLDVACGDRQIAVPHLWEDAQLRVGLDLDLNSLRANEHVDVCCGDIHTLPFAEKTFDVIVSVDTIEHSDEPDIFLAEVSRALRPGGIALIFTPHLWGYKTFIARVGGRVVFDLVWKLFYRRTLPYDAFYRANTARTLNRLASRAGMRLREVYYISEIPHFFYRSRSLSTAAFLYNDIVVRLRMPWLLNYMMAVLEKP
ncbi:class I SAM-dependent methyltransferase [Candidatus Parcubacteria bacterium]|nr:MAG: class I SAM-dependent methyltransferase [Candidatus Parcubacteria bacterium]